MWTGQKSVLENVENFNRSPTLMTSFLFQRSKVNNPAWKNKSNLQFYWFCVYINKCPKLFAKPEPKSDSLAKCFGWVLVDCRLVVGIRPEQASQAWCSVSVFTTGVYAACPLWKSLNTKWLFVKSKVIVGVNVLYGGKDIFFYCDPHARQMENNCVAELTAGLLEPSRQDWDSFIYI